MGASKEHSHNNTGSKKQFRIFDRIAIANWTHFRNERTRPQNEIQEMTTPEKTKNGHTTEPNTAHTRARAGDSEDTDSPNAISLLLRERAREVMGGRRGTGHQWKSKRNRKKRKTAPGKPARSSAKEARHSHTQTEKATQHRRCSEQKEGVLLLDASTKNGGKKDTFSLSTTTNKQGRDTWGTMSSSRGEDRV